MANLIVKALKGAANGGIELPAKLKRSCHGIPVGARGNLTLITGKNNDPFIHVSWATVPHLVDVMTIEEADEYLEPI